MAPARRRRQVQCALDAYLLLVVDAIEEATGKIFDRQNRIPPLGAGPAVGRAANSVVTHESGGDS